MPNGRVWKAPKESYDALGGQDLIGGTSRLMDMSKAPT